MNSPFEPSTGVNKMQYTLDARGRRHSSFRAFVPADVVAKRPNLHVCCGVLATKLEFSDGVDGLTAEGVEIQSWQESEARERYLKIFNTCVDTVKKLQAYRIQSRDQQEGT